MTPDDIERRFERSDFDAAAQANSASIRRQAIHLAHAINMAGPDSREKSLALTAIEEACMWGHRVIAVEVQSRG